MCGRVLSAGASVPVELGAPRLLWGVHQPGSSLNPVLLGFHGDSIM